jgi:hypothetical protein
MIDHAHDLPIAKQAEVLRISRGGCRKPTSRSRGVSTGCMDGKGA